jgi:hypothetical protein
VLRPQARVFAPSADAFDAHRLLGKNRQRQSRAQNLPTALAVRAINRYHRILASLPNNTIPNPHVAKIEKL